MIDLLETLEKMMEEYRKGVQKTKVRAMGRAGIQSKGAKESKIKRLGEQESKLAKTSISKATTGLQETVKGQFAKKVTEVFEQHQKKIDDF